jgi:hypothetical protein
MENRNLRQIKHFVTGLLQSQTEIGFFRAVKNMFIRQADFRPRRFAYQLAGANEIRISRGGVKKILFGHQISRGSIARISY